MLPSPASPGAGAERDDIAGKPQPDQPRRRIGEEAVAGSLHARRGAAPALTDVAAGRVTLYFSSLGPALPLIRDGRLRAIAVTSRGRMPQLPEVVAAALRNTALAGKLAEQGGILRPMSVAAFRSFVAGETRKFAGIVEDANITPEG